jgi:hypothetical protein
MIPVFCFKNEKIQMGCKGNVFAAKDNARAG